MTVDISRIKNWANQKFGNADKSGRFLSMRQGWGKASFFFSWSVTFSQPLGMKLIFKNVVAI